MFSVLEKSNLNQGCLYAASQKQFLDHPQLQVERTLASATGLYDTKTKPNPLGHDWLWPWWLWRWPDIKRIVGGELSSFGILKLWVWLSEWVWLHEVLHRLGSDSGQVWLKSQSPPHRIWAGDQPTNFQRLSQSMRTRILVIMNAYERRTQCWWCEMLNCPGVTCSWFWCYFYHVSLFRCAYESFECVFIYIKWVVH